MLEKDTRQLLIDQRLSVAGWDVQDTARVSEELLVHLAHKGRVSESNVSLGFCDYTLNDRSGRPIAVVEAKRTTRYALAGKEQAAEYADALYKQFGREPFIFLTNGVEIWFWDRRWAGPRPIQGFMSLEDLETLHFQHEHRQLLSTVSIDQTIVDRPYQIEAIRRVYEKFEQKKRKALLVLATGAGKTRLAMALIDGLLQTNWIKRVLFLVDRIALAEQAMDDFKEHLPSVARGRIEGGTIESGARAFVATYPSMMQVMEKLTPGFFNLIVYDESHRSIYRQYKRLLDYFDAYQIGLTATPIDFIDRNTFQLFGCDDGIPTFSFPFEDAINHIPPYLSKYKVYTAQTRFQLKGIKAGDLPLEIRRQLEEQGLSLEEINFEGTDLERRVTNTGTDEALVKEFMDVCLKDATGTLPGKSIIFAVSHRHAINLYKAFERLYPEYKGQLVEVIDSQMEGAHRLLRRFKTENYPRVAISVDMLDTGVDIHEVVNLVFAKPVYSRVKFWQMIGRGTRLLEADTLKRKPWCQEKEYFLIIDHWNNFEYFNLNPDGYIPEPSEALPVRRFRTQVDLLELLYEKGDEQNAEVLGQELRQAIKMLPSGFSEIQAAHADLEYAVDNPFWISPTKVEFAFLRSKIAGLFRFTTHVDEPSISFAHQIEKLALAYVRQEDVTIGVLRDHIRADLRLLPTTLREIKAKESELLDALSNRFWSTLNYAKIVALRDTFKPLMRYRRAQARSIVELSIADNILDRRWITFGPAGEGTYVETYRAQVEAYIKELAESHPIVKKIKQGDTVSDVELNHLIHTLNQADLFITEQNLRTTFGADNVPLLDLIRLAIGMIRLQTRAEVVGETFDRFIANHQDYSADQILFLRTIRTVLVQEAERTQKVHLTYNDLFEPPFTTFGRNAVERLFTREQIDEVLGLVEQLAA
jgi:type I restriction enzyme, R subunit